MDGTKPVKRKVCNFGPFLIKYWASGSGKTYIGIAKVPFKNVKSDWNEPFETKKIYTTPDEAERVVLESTKERLRKFCKEYNIYLNE
jgi:hypothetical protein